MQRSYCNKPAVARKTFKWLIKQRCSAYHDLRERRCLCITKWASPRRAFASSLANRDYNALIRSCFVIKTCNSTEKWHSRVLSSWKGVRLNETRGAGSKFLIDSKKKIFWFIELIPTNFFPIGLIGVLFEIFPVEPPFSKLHAVTAKICDSWPRFSSLRKKKYLLVLRLSNGD